MKLELLAISYLKTQGYYTDNLWHIDDVKNRFECTIEEAFEILNNAVSGELIIEEINNRINLFGKQMSLKQKE